MPQLDIGDRVAGFALAGFIFGWGIAMPLLAQQAPVAQQ